MSGDPGARAERLSASKRALLAELRKGKLASRAPEDRIPRRGEATAPLSFAQKRLWFLHQVDPESPAYNVPNALRLRGSLERALLERALAEVVGRHESLRTRFEVVRGEAKAVVDPPGTFEIELTDLAQLPPEEQEREVELEAQGEAAAPFDLERGPVLRARLIRLGPQDHVFLVTMHHIVSDGWSMGIFVRELAGSYRAFAEGEPPPFPELAVQYGDFAAWQREHFAGERLEAELAWWRERLDRLPAALHLPADRPRPPVQTFRGGVREISLAPEVVRGLEACAKAEQASLFMVLLAAFDALLHRLTGEEDLVVGTGIANRTRPETEPLIGFFVNALALRVNCGKNPTFTELVRRVREVALGAFQHQDLPFERLVEEVQPDRDLSKNPIFQVALALQNAPLDEIELPGLSVQPVTAPGNATRFDLEFHLWETEAGGIDGFLFFSTDLFDVATAQGFVERYARLCAGASRDATRRLSQLEIAAPGELDAVRGLLTGPRAPVPVSTVLEGFRSQLELDAGATAVEDGTRSLTYAELDRWSLALSRRLDGLGPGASVAVLAQRSIEQVVAALAAVRSGAAYVPLDPAHPDARLALMLERSGVAAALVTEAERERVPEGLRAIGIETWAANDAPADTAAPPEPESLAYVIFTSGSTGVPNGVEVSHENLANLVAWHRAAFGLGSEDRTALVAGPGFDASVWELWPTLASGATLCIPHESTRLDPARLRDWLVQRRITVAFLPTPLAERVLALDWPPCELRCLLTGGDRLHAIDARRFPFRIVNNYGPTEATVVATSGEADGGASLPAPTIGGPIANCRAYVLDAHLQPVPVGVAGELFVAGRGLARGYRSRPDLTAERFLPDPWGEAPGERMYRTGDRVRALADGRLEFLGRVDAQVKVRGQRIEPGEVAAVLAASPEVQAAHVRVLAQGGEGRLVAYVVPRQSSADVDRWAREHVDRWRDLYDETYGATPEGTDEGFNIVGWNSSYTGEPIEPQEMAEWRAATVERIRSLEPRRVLEIGCGTGLLLTQLAPDSERYVGCDLSPVSLRLVREALDKRGGLEHVQLYERSAEDFGGFEPESFDTVILNSVVQYFPDAEYLERVLAGALRVVAPGGRIFVGDVRDLRLQRAFAASVVRYVAPELDAEARERAVRQRMEQEEELLLHPAFFGRLADRDPRGAWARALVKRGLADNELTRFRYDVVIEVGERPEVEDLVRLGPEELSRVPTVLDRLPDQVWVGGLPNARLAPHVEAPPSPLEPLHPDSIEAWVTGRDYLSACSLSAAGGGFLDAVFVRKGHKPTSLAIPPPDPQEPLANTPVRVTRSGSFVPRLRAFAGERLPEVMQPSAYVVLEEFPLTANGKVDTRALPEPEEPGRAGAVFVAPESRLEHEVARAWSDVIGVQRISVDDDFFELGGHSLLATQVIARLRQEVRVEVPLRAIFEQRTVRRLAAYLESELDPSQGAFEPIPRSSDEGSLPLSQAQRRLWFIDRLEPGAAAYHIPNALVLSGELDAAALARSLEAIVERHAALRTRFEEGDGEPRQVVDAPRPLELQAERISGATPDERRCAAREMLQREALEPFDLECGPVLRVRLLELGPREHVLSLVVHHICADGWSMGVLVRELGALYAAESRGAANPLDPLPIQYGDWARWQGTWLAGGELERQLAFWREGLRGAEPLDLPTDRPRPAHPSYAGAALDVRIASDQVRALERLARREEATPHMCLLSVFSALLARWSGQRDFAVGTPVAGRWRAETEPLIGFFVNTLALRVRPEGKLSFREHLRAVRQEALAAYAHQDAPFERIVEELHPDRDTGRNPVFQVLFGLHNVQIAELSLGELEIAPFELEPATAQFDLELSLFESGGEIAGRLHWSTDLFERPTMERFAAHFQRLLDAVLEDPELELGHIPLLTPAEVQRWHELQEGAFATPPPDPVRRFELQVQRTPEAAALRMGTRELSYSELDRSANRLAHLLRERGLQPEDRVGLCFERGFDSIVSLLAVLKAGGACVPLDPALPTERSRAMLEDATPRLCLTAQALGARFVGWEGTLLLLEQLRSELESRSPRAPTRSRGPLDTLYVLFTSGSTGRPKGIAMGSGTLANLVEWQVRRSGSRPGRRTLQFAPLSFDVAFQEIFSSLGDGDTLVLCSDEERRDSLRLLRRLEADQVQRLFLPFVALEGLCEAAQEVPCELALREVITAGEALRVTPALRAFFSRLPGAVLDNQYGPTETHVATAERLACDPADWPDLPAIGTSLPGATLWLLDDELQLVPRGVLGEIYLGGILPARGYEGRADLTAERFVPDPFGQGTRLYRTGDLGRLTDGDRIEFHGRRDRQVKLRGYRVEPAEVEAQLARLEGVRSVAVVARSIEGRGLTLVAYVVPVEARRGRLETLREELKRRVPEFLVPSVFQELDALPLTPSGKLDQRALPDPEVSSSPESGSLSPLEEVVAAAFEHVLGVQGLGRDAHFFHLGGHSLLATRLAARLRRVTGVELSLRRLFEGPTVREVAAGVKALLGAAARQPALLPQRRGPRSLLSFQQERLWFLDRFEPGTAAYTISAALELRGPLNRSALSRAFEDLLRRHESLRTRFVGDDGRALQVVEAPVSVRLGALEVDEGDLEARLDALAGATFDLERGPLWRTLLLRVAPDVHVFGLALHHIVTDGWSMGVVVRELGEAYGAYASGQVPALPEPPIQYADYALWQRAWLGDGELDRQLAHWRKALAGVEPLELPTDRPRPAVRRHEGFRVRREVPPELGQELRELARSEGATLHMLLLAAYGAVLSRWSGQRDFAVGIPVANRTREETEGLVGYFVNTLALPMDLGGEELSWRELVARVRETTLAAYANQDLPFESLLEALQPPRDLARSPVFQVWFNLVNVPEQELRFGDLKASALGAEADESRFDLSLYAFEQEEELLLDAVANAALFDRWRIEELLDQLLLALGEMVARPDAGLDQLALVTSRASQLPDDRASLSEAWQGSVPERFAARARRAPHAPAVEDVHGRLTYEELQRHTGRLAGWLRAQGLGRGEAVAVFAHRSAATAAAMMGILQGEGAIVLLDPAHPPARLADLLRRSHLRALLALEEAGPLPAELEAVVAECGAACLSLPPLPSWEAVEAFQGIEPCEPELGPHDRACITFTSGTTGLPKGVLGNHGSLTHFQPQLEERFGLRAEDRFSMLSGLAHDPLQRDVFTCLLAGATLCVPTPEDLDPARLAPWVEESAVSVLCLTPALAKVLVHGSGSRRLEGVRRIFLLGERLWRRDVEELRRVAPNATLVNFYGTTETQRASACYVLPAGEPLRDEAGQVFEREKVPAGKGMDGVQLLVRTPAGRAAGLCELGELWVRSPHVSPGYLDPELDAARFTELGGVRCYRTGDLGRYLPDGVVQVEGRRDGQVNVRGFRVELGEVEAALAAQPGVADAACAQDEEGRLHGFVTVRDVAPLDPTLLREALRQRLPAHMVPTGVSVIEVMPLTPNGKLDRRALLGLQAPLPSRGDRPRTPREETLCRLFAEVLDAPSVGVFDDFFERGGHSLLAVRLLSRVATTFGVELPLRALFAAPNPAGLAQALAQSEPAPAGSPPKILRAPDAERGELSYAQRRLWFLDRLEPGSVAYNLPGALRLRGELDVECLARALAELERRHESLRTRFEHVDGEPRQVFVAPRPQVLHIDDLGDDEQPSAELERRLRREASTPFDLEAGPLWRARLFRLSGEEHVLSLVLHHIVTDGWSGGILTRELAQLYAAYADGRESPLAEPELQYADWAAWQRRWLEAGELERQLAWWRDELGDVEALEVPTDRPRPPRRGLRARTVSFELDLEEASRLQELVRSEGATLFHGLCACFQALLARLAGVSDVVVGTPVAGRGAAQAEDLVGFFANTLALRVDASPELSLRALLSRVRDKTLEAHEHQDVPFETVVDSLDPERHLSRNPIFDAMFVLRQADASSTIPGRLDVEPWPTDTGSTAFDLTLFAGEVDGKVFGALQADADLFEQETVERFAGYYRDLVALATSEPDLALGEIDLRSQAERDLIAATNETQREVPPQLWHELVEEQAILNGDALAVVDEDRRLTYGELDRWSNRLARRLRNQGVGPETGVGLFAGRGVQAIAGMLAVWKSGGTLVPLDASLPAERLASMVRDAGVEILLSERGLERALGSEMPCVPLEGYGLEAEDPRALQNQVDPRQAAYVIFTSGSTGEPKGSVVEHRALVARAAGVARFLELEPGERALAFFSFTFDGSLHEILPTLARGATLVVHPDPRGDTPSDFLDRCEREGIHVAHAPVGFFHEVSLELERSGRSVPSPMRRFLTGGEGPQGVRLAVFLGHAPADFALTNAYGPTETVITAAFEDVRIEECARGLVPIGVPSENTKMLLLDRGLHPVPVGAVGDLYIAGPLLARGYARRGGQTAGVFVPDPFSGQPGARMYRTGDLARLMADGRLVFVGRRDHQVKLRGYRVELGEVEQAMARLAEVDEGIVTVRRSGTAATLVAYFVAAPGAAVEGENVRALLRRELPEYMVPQVVVRLDAMPRHPSGKLDRRSLPEPRTLEARGERTGPRDEAERALAPLWQAILELESVDVREGFFEAGGNSLLAIRLVAAVRRELEVELPVAALFQTPVFEDLARVVATGATVLQPFPGAELVRLRSGTEGSPLVLFPAVAGGVSDFAELARSLRKDVDVWVAPSVGTNLPAQVEDLAALHLRSLERTLPDGPLRLVGWSHGGLVALEVARRLQAKGRSVQMLVLLDIPCPGADPEGAPSPESQLASWMPSEDALPEGLSVQELDDWRNAIADRIRSALAFRPQPYAGDVLLVRGTDSVAGRSLDEHMGWPQVVQGRVHLEWVPGSHESILTGEGARVIAGLLESASPRESGVL